MQESSDFNTHIDLLIRIALIIGIVAWSFQLLEPLLGVIAWGFILAVILYPIQHWLCKVLGGHPIIASSIITCSMVLLVMSITGFITNDIAHSVSAFTSRMSAGDQLPNPPEFIQKIPLVGEDMHDYWLSTSVNLKTEMQKYSSVLLEATKYIFGKLANTGKDLLLFIVSIIFAGFLLVRVTQFTFIMNKFVDRIAKTHGREILGIVKQTIQSVSRGVIGIALLQAIIFAILIAIAKVPGIGILSLIALLLSIVQVGLFILIIPIIIWLFFTKGFVFALIISILLVLDSLIDSFLKPIVLARGLTTPTIIIFLGLIGGIIVYGLIGVFIGPVVLAIAYDLMNRWVGADSKEKHRLKL